MTIVSTKELINHYLTVEMDEVNRYKNSGTIDRAELYAYEEKIGKQLVEMSLEEIIDMVFSFAPSGKRENHTRLLSKNTIMNIISRYRMIIYFYMDNYPVEPFNNPLRDRKKCEAAISKRFGTRKGFNKSDFDELIRKAYTTYNDDRATYLECLMRVFFDGFRDAAELVTLKEEQIDFVNKTVAFEDRVVQLSKRTFMLLKEVHSMDFCGDGVGVEMRSWRGGYFKIPIKKKTILEDFDKLEIEDVVQKIRIKMSSDLNSLGDKAVKPYTLFLLGFTEKLIEKYGKEEIERTFSEHGGKDAIRILRAEAPAYGVNLYNVSVIKQKILEMLE